MAWRITYLPDAINDLEELDGAVRKDVLTAIKKVSNNPLPKQEGGYGLPLGNHNETKLAGLLKIVLMKAGIRIVYRLKRQDGIMNIIVISARAESKVYKIAHDRKKNH